MRQIGTRRLGARCARPSTTYYLLSRGMQRADGIALSQRLTRASTKARARIPRSPKRVGGELAGLAMRGAKHRKFRIRHARLCSIMQGPNRREIVQLAARTTTDDWALASVRLHRAYLSFLYLCAHRPRFGHFYRAQGVWQNK